MIPAWQTTEFWVTFITNIVGMVTLLGYVTPENAETITAALIQIAGAVLMLATSFGFIKGRTALRQAVIAAIAADSSAAGTTTEAIRAAKV